MISPKMSVPKPTVNNILKSLFYFILARKTYLRGRPLQDVAKIGGGVSTRILSFFTNVYFVLCFSTLFFTAIEYSGVDFGII